MVFGIRMAATCPTCLLGRSKAEAQRRVAGVNRDALIIRMSHLFGSEDESPQLLKHWARDRRRGERIPLEFLVHKQTRGNALAYGLPDRGLIAPGMKADLNLIDFSRLDLLRPTIVHDMPAGGRRFIQRARGYRHTFVSGVEILRDDELTGALPGQLVRGAAAAVSA